VSGSTIEQPRDVLERGITTLSLALSNGTLETLDRYLDLIVKWNAVHNLTAIRDKHEMVTHHLLDSLAAAPHVPSRAKLLDVGSGAGLPGLPLALARSDLDVFLLDSNQKKTAFLQQAIATLPVPNARTMATRVEDWLPAERFDVIISRAFSELADFLKLTRHLAAPNGRWFAMKGVYPHEELARLPAGFALERAVRLDVPGLAAQRHLLILASQ
jgi:16S rRNA (guanine527-N7)-methyltransferase